MPNPAFVWPATDYENAIKSGIATILLYDRCYEITDIEDATELEAAIASNDVYKLCPLIAELPAGETNFITQNTSKGPKELPSDRKWTLTFESYLTVDKVSNAKLLDGSTKWRVAIVNTDAGDTRLLTFFDKEVDYITLTSDYTGNSKENLILIKGEAAFVTQIKTGATNTSNGEVYDITANDDLIALIDCESGGC